MESKDGEDMFFPVEKQEKPKVSLTPSSSNSQNEKLHGYETQPHYQSFFASFRNLKVLFVVLLLCGITSFAIIPTVALLSFHQIQNQIVKVLVHQVSQLVSYFSLMLIIDEADIDLFYYTYFGSQKFLNELLEDLESSTNQLVTLMTIFCSETESCTDSTVSTLSASYSTLISTKIPAFQSELSSIRTTLSEYVSQSSLRDTLAESFVSSDNQALLSRPTYMIANAKIECYLIESCWSSTDVQTFLSSLEEDVGNLVGSALAVANDIFSVIEDARLGGTTATEIIDLNAARNTLRTTLVGTLATHYTATETLVAPLEDPTTVTTELQPFYFVLTPTWGSALMTALSGIVNWTTDLNDEYLSSLSSTGTPVEVDKVLSYNASEAEVMSLAAPLHSFFAYDVGTGLTMSLSDEEAANIAADYNTSISTYIATLRTYSQDLYTPAQHSVKKLVNPATRHDDRNHILRMSVSAAAAGCVLTAGFYFAALYIARYHLGESPLPFLGLFGIISGMFVLQVGISIVIVVRLAGVPEDARAFTDEFFDNLDAQCQIADYVSSLTRIIVQTALLIASDYTSTSTLFQSLSEALVNNAYLYETQSWYSSFLNLQIILNIFRAGTYSVRQGFTAASSLNFTTVALMDTFGITGVDYTPATAAESCNVITGAATLVQLNSQYYALSSIRSQLATGSAPLTETEATDVFSSASLHSSCLIAYILYKDGQETCFDATTCSDPPTYGMLRSNLLQPDGTYSIFNPYQTDSFGTLLQAVETLRDALAEDLQSILSEAEEASRSDASTMGEARRFVVWVAIFTALTLLCCVIVIRALLFGHSLFSIFA